MFRVFALAVLALLAPLEGGGVMFAATQIYLGRCAKAAPTAKSYVQNGLVAMWDGIENAGWGVHDQNATAWKDLVGGANQDFVLTEHGSWGDKFLITDGAGPAALCGKIFPYSSVLTVECVARMTTAVSGATMFNLSPGYLVSPYYFLTRNLSWFTDKNATGFSMSGRREINGKFRVGYLASPGSDISFSGKYAGGGPRCSEMYANGAAQTNTGIVQGAAGSANVAVIGNRLPDSVACPSAGRLYTLRLYSRALTAEEIAANYAIDKERFNLP